ncbi:hypothetical protein BYT27DRAFT_6766835 [Phlegmacium glaucopus]|nr:hypothetical protein BYT27DRAFT_6766835 [Phlegmacium glaucopus]
MYNPNPIFFWFFFSPLCHFVLCSLLYALTHILLPLFLIILILIFSSLSILLFVHDQRSSRLYPKALQHTVEPLYYLVSDNR